MRVLVGWDVEREIDLVVMYLQVDENDVDLVRTPAELVERFRAHHYDVVLFPLTFPDADQAFDAYREILKLEPLVPVLVASRPGEIYPLSRFIRHGLRSHVFRDPEGEYLFLLQALIESTLLGKKAEQARQLAARLREEIDAVRKLQESILPRNLRAPKGYDIVARYEPSQIRVTDDSPIVLAGGDYYHAFQIEQKLVLLVGDASGHGMKACMSIMSMHTLINQLHDDHKRQPHEFVAEINRRLCSDNLVQSDGGFITLLYGYIEDDVFHWTSAGHPAPLVHHRESDEIASLDNGTRSGGPPLAVFDESEYRTVSTPIVPQDRVMIYTDGIIEAFPEHGKHAEFGLSGVFATLRRCRAAPLATTLEALFRESYSFTHGAGRHDDTSVLLVDRR